MIVTIMIGAEDIKEAILEHIKRHRPDFIDVQFEGDHVPTIEFVHNGQVLEVLGAKITQHLSVHQGNHPYR